MRMVLNGFLTVYIADIPEFLPDCSVLAVVELKNLSNFLFSTLILKCFKRKLDSPFMYTSENMANIGKTLRTLYLI